MSSGIAIGESSTRDEVAALARYLHDALTAERVLAEQLAAALRGWELLDKACDMASGRSDDPAVRAASERLDETFVAVWAARDAALAAFDAARVDSGAPQP